MSGVLPATSCAHVTNGFFDVSATGVLTTGRAGAERPVAVLLNPNAYHMVTVTTLFGTTITIPVTQIASIE